MGCGGEPERSGAAAALRKSRGDDGFASSPLSLPYARGRESSPGWVSRIGSCSTDQPLRALSSSQEIWGRGFWSPTPREFGAMSSHPLPVLSPALGQSIRSLQAPDIPGSPLEGLGAEEIQGKGSISKLPQLPLLSCPDISPGLCSAPPLPIIPPMFILWDHNPVLGRAGEVFPA